MPLGLSHLEIVPIHAFPRPDAEKWGTLDSKAVILLRRAAPLFGRLLYREVDISGASLTSKSFRASNTAAYIGFLVGLRVS